MDVFTSCSTSTSSLCSLLRAARLFSAARNLRLRKLSRASLTIFFVASLAPSHASVSAPSAGHARTSGTLDVSTSGVTRPSRDRTPPGTNESPYTTAPSGSPESTPQTPRRATRTDAIHRETPPPRVGSSPFTLAPAGPRSPAPTGWALDGSRASIRISSSDARSEPTRDGTPSAFAAALNASRPAAANDDLSLSPPSAPLHVSGPHPLVHASHAAAMTSRPAATAAAYRPMSAAMSASFDSRGASFGLFPSAASHFVKPLISAAVTHPCANTYVLEHVTPGLFGCLASTTQCSAAPRACPAEDALVFSKSKSSPAPTSPSVPSPNRILGASASSSNPLNPTAVRSVPYVKNSHSGSNATAGVRVMRPGARLASIADNDASQC